MGCVDLRFKTLSWNILKMVGKVMMNNLRVYLKDYRYIKRGDK